MCLFRHPMRSCLAALLLAALLPACSKKDRPAPSASAAAEVASAAEDSASGSASIDAARGAALYDSVCAICHAEGVGQAPRPGHQGDWETRLNQGEDALMQSVLNGKGIMPPKGTAMDASEDELRAAVRYMSQGSASAPVEGE